MSRPIRIEFANALYHVTSRGDRREAIFDDDDDTEYGVRGQVLQSYISSVQCVKAWGQVYIRSMEIFRGS